VRSSKILFDLGWEIFHLDAPWGLWYRNKPMSYHSWASTSEPVAFNVKNSILVGLRENQYDGGSLQDPYEHLSMFYESCLFCCPDGVTEDQKKL